MPANWPPQQNFGLVNLGQEAQAPTPLLIHPQGQGGIAAAIAWQDEAVNGKKRQKLPVDENSTVGEVFGVHAPEKVSIGTAEEFIRLNRIVIEHPYVFSDPKSLVGLEIEIENVMYINPNIPLAFWQIAEDGSLRNNGREFKTLALQLTMLEPALKQLAEGLNPNVDFSVRTSVHVHQDIRGMSMGQLTGLLLTYLSVESLLFKFAGNNRRNNIYCVPLIDTDVIGRMSNQQQMIEMLRTIAGHWHKYTAMNLLPIRTFGTVEYRHMPGTLDVKKLLIWVDLLSRLKIFAYKHDFRELVDTINGLNSNSRYKEYVESVFGDITGYLDLSNLQLDMERGVFMVKNATIANQFHEKVINSPLLPESQVGTIWHQKTIDELIGDPKKVVLFKQVCSGYWPGQDLVNLYNMMTVNSHSRQEYLSAISPVHRKLLKAVLTPGELSEDYTGMGF